VTGILDGICVNVNPTRANTKVCGRKSEDAGSAANVECGLDLLRLADLINGSQCPLCGLVLSGTEPLSRLDTNGAGCVVPRWGDDETLTDMDGLKAVLP
jgi:hypothetical protein